MRAVRRGYNRRMLDRREFLKAAALAALAPTACVTSTKQQGAWVNDIHSQLNRTWVSGVRKPTSVAELRAAVGGNGPVCIAARSSAIDAGLRTLDTHVRLSCE